VIYKNPVQTVGFACHSFTETIQKIDFIFLYNNIIHIATMGMYTQFTGTLTTSRPLTQEELDDYQKELDNYDITSMYLIFVDGSRNELQGIENAKVCGYLDMKEGFMNTVNWMKYNGIKLYGRINYVYEDMFTDVIGGGFGAFVVTHENVTYHQLDFNGLKMISNVVY
jgi:hypothetical protein